MFNWIVQLPISGAEINGYALILLGFSVGIIGGFFGVGGAFMVTPALNVFGFPMAYAIGTDMAHIAGKSIVATFKHRKFGHVDMRLGLLMIVGTVIGIELGALLVMWLEKIGRIGPIVRGTYVCLLFGMGFYMWYEYIVTNRRFIASAAAPQEERSKLARLMQSIDLPPMIHLKVSGFRISIWVIIVVGIFTGFLAGFLGVGGGFIRMPALMYMVGSPTKVAVGTDLFEVMFSGAYGAFTYALKGRVELLAAIIMLAGAAIGAQIGATATAYARGTIIRLYFALTMISAGVSVIFKHIADTHARLYKDALLAWARQSSGLSDPIDMNLWLFRHKADVALWLEQQTPLIQEAWRSERLWSHLSGYLMLGSACALSSVIIFWLIRGVLRERTEAAHLQHMRTQSGLREDTRTAGTPSGLLMIAASCTPADLPGIRMGAQIARNFSQKTTVLVCEESGICEANVKEARRIIELAGITPEFRFVDGEPHQEILQHSAQARLLVIGSRPLSAMNPQYHLGDNATRIIRRMTTSTLVVRGRNHVGQILLYVDVPHSHATVDMARDVALATGASIDILYIASVPTMYTADNPVAAEGSQKRGLLNEYEEDRLDVIEAIRDGLRAVGVPRVGVLLREGFVEEEIIRSSIEGNYDLIVLNEVYLRGPTGMLLGGLSTNVATRSPQASVLIVKRRP
jgi:uncharacterized membrane protein YfcA/nucleotide-binding universal stress UspA family protein